MILDLLDNYYRALDMRLSEAQTTYNYTPAIASVIDKQYTVLSRIEGLMYQYYLTHGKDNESASECLGIFPELLRKTLAHNDQIWEKLINDVVDAMEVGNGTRKEAELIASNHGKRIENMLEAFEKAFQAHMDNQA